MPGFFDQINLTTQQNFCRSAPCRKDSFTPKPSKLDTFNVFPPKSDTFNVFAPKPMAPANKSETAKIWTADDDEFGYQFPMRSIYDPPLIENVLNASQFVNSGDSLSKNNNNMPVIRRQKYMPDQKSTMELLDDQYQIHEGPVFDKVFGLENDCEISVTGGNGKCPIISSFENCNFRSEILENIALKKYRTPTQIQKSDIMGHAQTGSGKTASFVLPIIHEIQLFKEKKGMSKNGSSPYAIIIAPTKELAEQLANDARLFSENTDVRVAVSYGDMPLRENVKQIRFGCDIFVATCGRLVHFIRDEILKLTNLKFLVLDEADKLLNDTFFDDIKAIKLHKEMNATHRTFMFSATFGEDIQNLAQVFLCDDYYFVRVGEMNRPADTVRQLFIKVQKYDKQDLLLKILMSKAKEKRREDNTTYFEINKVIVFVQHRRQSDRLAIALAQSGFLVTSINADRTLKQRFDAAEKFVTGLYQILVATDVAARGLNFPKVSWVINYDLPEVDSASYIHRIGRAGRAGNLGTAISFFDLDGKESQHIAFYVQNLRSSGQSVPSFMEECFKSQQMSDFKIRRAYNRETGGDCMGTEWF